MTQETSATPTLPRYRSHKEVSALKIKEVKRVGETDPRQAGLLVFEDETYGTKQVSFNYLMKHTPKAGGFWILYDDGYESWSPAEAFESGYDRI